MSILCIVSIFGLITVPVVVLSCKICSSDITVSFIELVINNIGFLISNNILANCPSIESLAKLFSVAQSIYLDAGSPINAFIPSSLFQIPYENSRLVSKENLHR